MSGNGQPSRQVKIAVAAIAGLVVVGLSIFLIVGRSSGLANSQGFFGTRASLFADLNLIAQLILLSGLTVGYGFARRGNIPAHQYNQTSWVFVNIALTVFIMAVAFNQQVRPGIPEKLLRAYYGTATVHAVLGTLTILIAIYLLLLMNRLLPRALQIRWWKNLMRFTLGMYWLVGLFGLGTYYYWYLVPRDVSGAPEVAAEAGVAVVPMANFVFNPFELEVPVGTTVLFVNQDEAPHTVTFDNSEFAESYYELGDTHEIAFDQPGEFWYFCVFHGSPGGNNMAGVIRVVAPGVAGAPEVAVVPTAVTPPTATPQPTAAPPAEEPFEEVRAVGLGRFWDVLGRSDAFALVASGVGSPAAGELHVWLTGAAGALDLGTVAPDASGNLTFGYVDSEGANLLARFSGFQVTVETTPTPAAPAGEIVVEGSIPANTLFAAQQLLVGADDAPGNRAYAVALIAQAEELLRHVKAVHGAALVGDFDSLNRHAEHAFTIVEGVGGPNYRDFDGDGQIVDPGDGFGILNYAAAIAAEAAAAASGPEVTPNIELNAARLTVLAENVQTWASAVVNLGIRAHQATTAAEQQAATEQMLAASTALLNGIDADGDGVIGPVVGEGGAFTIYAHAQHLAAMGALATR